MLPILPILSLLSSFNAGIAPDSVAWRVKGEVQGSPFTQTCVVTQIETTLSGRCTSDDGKIADMVGEVKDDKVTFQHGGDYQGQELTIIYTGTMLSPTEVKGTILVKPFDATGTFTAAPVPPKP